MPERRTERRRALEILGLALPCAMLILFTRTTGAVLTQDEERPVPTYVGAQSCKKCHAEQLESWGETRMGNAFDLLRPGVRHEEKLKAGLDPEKDYTADEECLPCHTTGWQQPGGYAIPPTDDSPESQKLRELAEARQGVQCEACHGPASLAIAYKKDAERFQWTEVEKAGALSGMLFPAKETCVGCHNTDSPFVGEDYVFDFDKRKEEGTHFHQPMDFDHGCPHEHTPSKKKRKKKKKKDKEQ